MISEDRTLRHFYEATYVRQRLLGRSMNTKRLYSTNLNLFDLYLGRPATLDDLDDDTLAAVMEWMLDARGNKPSTVNRWRKAVCAIWRFAASRRIIEQFPTLPNLRSPRRSPRAFTREQLESLWNAIRSLPGSGRRI